jgi:hypothetical protein
MTRKLGISEATYYAWRKRYGQMAWITGVATVNYRTGFMLTGTKVVAALERVANRMGHPQMITVDNGSEFTFKVFDAWAHAHEVMLDFFGPGNPSRRR